MQHSTICLIPCLQHNLFLIALCAIHLLVLKSLHVRGIFGLINSYVHFRKCLGHPHVWGTSAPISILFFFPLIAHMLPLITHHSHDSIPLLQGELRQWQFHLCSNFHPQRGHATTSHCQCCRVQVIFQVLCWAACLRMSASYIYWYRLLK